VSRSTVRISSEAFDGGGKGISNSSETSVSELFELVGLGEHGSRGNETSNVREVVIVVISA
jgi:hypothetical protein